MKTISFVLLNTLLFANAGHSKSKSKQWWIMKQTEACIAAVGFMEPDAVLKSNPGCKKDTNFPPGIMALDCRNTEIGTQLAYFDSVGKCKRMMENLKNQGF